MKCIKCNVTLPKDSKNCLSCGTLFDNIYFDSVSKFVETTIEKNKMLPL